MKSPLFNSESVKLLLALRTRTVEGIRSDFKGLFPDTSCPLGCGKPDTLQNILACSVLTSLHTSVNPAVSSVQFEDIFSSDVTTQKQVTELFMELLKLRTSIMNDQPVVGTGPVQGI